MRVGLVLEQCLAPVPGGTGRYSRELARALALTAPAGASVTGWTAWHRRVAAVSVAGVRGPRRLPAGRRLLAAGWERGHGPAPARADLVHAPTLLLPPRRDRPLVVTVHDAVPWTHPELLTARGAAFHRRMGARAAAEADLVVVPTVATREALRAHLPLREVAVVGEGVSAALALPPDALARAQRLRLPAGYVATLATLEPRKGLDVLLRAAARTALPVVVVGQPGWGGVDPAREAARAGLPPDRLHVLGRLPDPDVAVVLARALAVAVPSRREGFGLPALEAMSLGTPVVVSADPALVEVTGGAALVTPVDDADALAAALAQLADDAPLRDRLARAGRERAAGFRWTDAARELWRWYGRLIGQPAEAS